MLNSNYYRFSDLYSVCLKTIGHLSFKLCIFSEHITSFKFGVLKVQDFGNFELSPMHVCLDQFKKSCVDRKCSVLCLRLLHSQ